MMFDFRNANSGRPLSVVVPPLPSGWIPPSEGRIKLNSDASITAVGDACLGGAFRDHNAILIKTFAEFCPNCNDVELAEGLAFLQGIQVAQEEGFNDLVEESNN